LHGEFVVGTEPGDELGSYMVQGQSYPGGLSRRFILKGRADKWIGRYTNDQPSSIRYNPTKAKASARFERQQLGN